MNRSILLLDVTAMAADAICVAGIDLKSRETVRLHEPQPTRRLAELIGCIRPLSLIDIRYEQRPGSAPHVEDCWYDPRSIKLRETVQLDSAEELLQPIAFQSVTDAFGEPDFDSRGRPYWRPGTGARSLATVLARGVGVTSSGHRPPRCSFTDAKRTWNDVYFQDVATRSHLDCPECSGPGYASNIREEFDANRTLVRVGLTRPFAPEGNEPVCWLQVTNILAKPREHFI